MSTGAATAVLLPAVDGRVQAAEQDEWRLADWALVLVLVVVSTVYLIPFVSGDWEIYEDAAILFRYAGHVADGHGIVWNIGERPVDGATDLLFMWLIAACHRWGGMSLEAAARGIAGASHVALVALVYFAGRTIARGPRMLVGLSALYLAFGPAKAYVAGGFGTPVFALAVGGMWCAALVLARRPTVLTGVLFGGAAVIAGIARPEGALLAIYTTVGLLVFRIDRSFTSVVGIAVAVGLAAGGLYWAWRWNYFGHPLPNPYYRKGGGRIYLWNLLVTAKYGALHIAPFGVPMALGLCSRTTRRVTLLAAIPVAAFLASWILLSNEMNFARRFQYPVVPIVAIAWPMWLSTRANAAIRDFGADGPALMRAGFFAMLCAVAGGTLWYQHEQFRPGLWHQDLRDLGLRLAPYGDRGYTMAVSEAGLLPFYSGWHAVDIWGLNDEWIAHHQVITDEYLSKRRPELIMFFASCAPGSSRRDNAWERMVSVTDRYARSRRYALVAVAPRDNGDGATFFYAKTDFDGAAEVAATVRDWAGPANAGPPPVLRPCPLI